MAFYSLEMKYIFGYGVIKRRDAITPNAFWIIFIEHTFSSTHQSLGYDKNKCTSHNVRRAC